MNINGNKNSKSKEDSVTQEEKEVVVDVEPTKQESTQPVEAGDNGKSDHVAKLTASTTHERTNQYWTKHGHIVNREGKQNGQKLEPELLPETVPPCVAKFSEVRDPKDLDASKNKRTTFSSSKARCIAAKPSETKEALDTTSVYEINSNGHKTNEVPELVPETIPRAPMDANVEIKKSNPNRNTTVEIIATAAHVAVSTEARGMNITKDVRKLHGPSLFPAREDEGLPSLTAPGKDRYLKNKEEFYDEGLPSSIQPRTGGKGGGAGKEGPISADNGPSQQPGAFAVAGISAGDYHADMETIMCTGSFVATGDCDVESNDNAATDRDAESQPNLISAVLVKEGSAADLATTRAVVVREPKFSRKCLICTLSIAIIGLIAVVLVSMISRKNDNNTITPPVDPTPEPEWERFGQKLNGENAGDRFGQSISLSSDGSCLAIGVKHADGINESEIDAGEVRVFQLISETKWALVGGLLKGTGKKDFFGVSISLSSNDFGNKILAVGASGAGYVKVFQCCNGKSEKWEQLGQTLRSEGEKLGSAVALSRNGSRLAVGTRPSNKISCVRVYQFVNVSSILRWEQLGAPLKVGATDPWYGGAPLSLSNDGNKVAIGATSISYGEDLLEDDSGIIGEVQVFCLVPNSNGDYEWHTIGSVLKGDTSGDWFGYSVSMSGDGNSLAVGAVQKNRTGWVRLFQYNGTEWEAPALQHQNKVLVGKTAMDQFGGSVSLSDNGTVLAVGAKYKDTQQSDVGEVQVFHLVDEQWQQVGQALEGESFRNRFGFSVSLSSDGNKVAIGAIGNTEKPKSAGYVQTFRLNLTAK